MPKKKEKKEKVPMKNRDKFVWGEGDVEVRKPRIEDVRGYVKARAGKLPQDKVTKADVKKVLAKGVLTAYDQKLLRKDGLL